MTSESITKYGYSVDRTTTMEMLFKFCSCSCI